MGYEGCPAEIELWCLLTRAKTLTRIFVLERKLSVSTADCLQNLHNVSFIFVKDKSIPIHSLPLHTLRASPSHRHLSIAHSDHPIASP